LPQEKSQPVFPRLRHRTFTNLTCSHFHAETTWRAVADPTYPTGSAPPAAAPPLTPEQEATRRKRKRTSAKGAEVELLAIKLLEAAGYTVHRCVRTGIKRGPIYISQSNDVFGCIDLVAKKKGERTRWLQVTAHSGVGKKRQEILEVPWDPLYDSVEIWRWVGGRTRKSKVTGEPLARQYFQVYHLDEGFELRPDRRVPVGPGSDTLAHDPDNRALWEVEA
jgi:hypothetical protein